MMHSVGNSHGPSAIARGSNRSGFYTRCVFRVELRTQRSATLPVRELVGLTAFAVNPPDVPSNPPYRPLALTVLAGNLSRLVTASYIYILPSGRSGTRGFLVP